MRAGRLIAVERLEELRAKALHRVVARLAGPVDVASFARVAGLRDLSLEDGVLRCGVPEASIDAVVKALAGYRVVDLSITEADLEEMFLTFYGEPTRAAA